MRATILLADSAEAVNGKVYALGLGWTEVGTPTPPHAIAVFIDVDWTETNRPFAFEAGLVNSDGQPVVIATELGEQPVVINGTLEAGRPPGLPHGTPVRMPMAATLGPLPLAPGRYEWRVTIDGQHEETWSASFTVRAP